MGRRLIISCLVITLATAFCLVGCSKKEQTKDFLQIQLSTEPVTLNPTLAEDGVSLRVINNLMDGLMGYDGAGRLVYRLAESVQVSPDRKRYEFTLRKKGLWSDGVPVHAEDFVRGIRRSLDPKTAGKLGSLLSSIKTVSAESGRVLVELKTPISYFLDLMTLPPAMPVRPERGGAWSESGPVTGPYRIARHQTDQEILLMPNEKYWGYDPGQSARPPVLLRIVQDDSTAVSLFERGELDILTKVPSLDLSRLSRLGVVHTDPFMATYYLSFNLKKAPFDQRDARRAVAGMIRRDEIVSALATGERPARSWIPNGLDGHIPYVLNADGTSPLSDLFADSIKRFRAKTRKLPEVSTSFDGSTRNSLIMEKIQHDLRTGLGLRLSLSLMDWKSYVKLLGSDSPPLFRFGWLAPFADPISHLQAFTSGDPNNYAGWSHLEYDRLVSEIASMPKGPERDAKVRKAQRILVDQEAIVIPIFHYVQNHAVGKRISGFKVNSLGVIRFDELSLVH